MRQFASSAATIGFAVFVGLFAKNIDVSDHHWSRETIWFVVLGVIAVVVAGIKDISKERKERGKFSDSPFLDLYSQSLSGAVQIWPEYTKATEAQLLQGIQTVLLFICTVVRAYHHDRKSNIKANVMVAYHPTKIPVENFHAKVNFAYVKLKPEDFSHVLKIIAWSKDDSTNSSDYWLPVHSDKEQVLFGAPDIFTREKTDTDWVHFSDVKKIKTNLDLISHHEKVVKREIVNYFSTVSFRSFASIRINCPNSEPAVLNIESDERHILGFSKEIEDEMVKYIRPFCAVLGYMIQELSTIEDRVS